MFTFIRNSLRGAKSPTEAAKAITALTTIGTGITSTWATVVARETTSLLENIANMPLDKPILLGTATTIAWTGTKSITMYGTLSNLLNSSLNNTKKIALISGGYALAKTFLTYKLMESGYDPIKSNAITSLVLTIPTYLSLKYSLRKSNQNTLDFS